MIVLLERVFRKYMTPEDIKAEDIRNSQAVIDDKLLIDLPGESIHVQQFLYHDFVVGEGTFSGN